MAWIAAAAMALYGAYEGKRTADKQKRAQDEAISYARSAREAAGRQLGGKKIWGAAEEYFPGLVAPPVAMVEARNKLNDLGTKAEGEIANAKNPKKLKYWQHTVKKTQRASDSLEHQLNPWGYLQQNNMAGSVPSAPQNPPMGAPLSGPIDTNDAGAQPPIHGGVDPTNLPGSGVDMGMGTNTSGGAPTGAVDPTTPATPPPSSGVPGTPGAGAAPPPAGQNSGQSDQTYRQNQTPRQAKKAAKQQRKMDKLHKNDPTFTANNNDVRSGQIYPGQLVMQHLQDLLQNPGRLEDTTYQRAQEQSNEALNMAEAAGTARVMGAGVDPRSGIGQITQENALLNFGKERNEAARDYSIAQEDLRRRDIQQGMEDYTNFLNMIFGLQGKRSNAKSGGTNEAYNYNTAAGGSSAAMGQSASQIGNALGGINYGGGSSGPSSTDASSTTDTGSWANRNS